MKKEGEKRGIKKFRRDKKKMKKIVAVLVAMLMVMSVTVALAGGAKDVNPEADAGLTEVTQEKGSQDIKSVYDGEQICFKCKFAKPIVERGEYDRVKVKSLRNIVNPGEPVLPFKTLNILLPQGKTVQSIEVTGNQIHLFGEYHVEPGQEPVPLGSKSNYMAHPDPAIYESMNPFPGKMFTKASIQELRGYKILILNLYPVQYIPKAGKIFYLDSMNVIVNTAPETISDNFRGLPQDKTRVLGVVDNPEVVETYSTSAPTLSQSYDYVIITKDSFVSAFQPLADWKNQRGVNTTIVTVEDIYANYSGVDNQEKIRNFIKDAYNNWSIEYVLLGGDGDGDDVGEESGDTIIPHRGFYAYVGTNYVDDDIPADLYYAALDGNWNDDEDDRWGEPGEDDLYAEVYVGRAPVDSEAEVSNFVNKTIAYESTNAPYLMDALMVGEDLEWTKWGGDYKDEIKDGSSAGGYITVGFPDEYNVSTLYDRDLDPDRWDKYDLIPMINDGVHIINHLGHAWVNYVMKMDNSDVDNLTNDEYFFGYSQGCYDGSFDNRGTSGNYSSSDCISEHLTTTSHGAFAFIGNSRYGWGNRYSTDGASQHYDREFYDALFGENILNIGKANQDSKEDNIGFINNAAMRWCYYEITLFGDPETPIWRIPKPPELSVTVDAPAKVGNYKTFDVTAIISNSGTETATGVNATISWIPRSGLNTTELPTRYVGNISDGDSETVSWNVTANTEGRYNITVEASATNAAPANDTTTVEVIGYSEDVANAEETVKGTVTTGSYVDTHASDDVYEAITEIESKGNPAKRYSYLEHKWTIDVTGGSEVTFYVEANHTVNTEGDDFEFEYSNSLDGTYTPMVTVTNTSDTDTYQTYELPKNTEGTVYIRVMDTDQTKGNRTLDTISIDQMFIRSVFAPPSYGVTVTIDETSQTVKPGNSTTYAVRTKNTGDLDASYSVVMTGTAVDDSNITVNPLNWNTGTLAPNAENVTTVTVSTNSSTPEKAYALNATATCDQNTSVMDYATSKLVVSSLTNAMHIASINMSLKTAGPNTNAIALVTIVDANNNPVGSATVEGRWSNATSDTDSGTTDASGHVSLDSDKVKNPLSGTTFTFTVDGVSLTGWTYASASNVETSDSITV